MTYVLDEYTNEYEYSLPVKCVEGQVACHWFSRSPKFTFITISSAIT